MPSNDWTPLFWAVDKDFYYLAEILIEQGKCNVLHQDKYGFTAMDLAKEQNKPKLVGLIGKNGGKILKNPEIKEDYGIRLTSIQIQMFDMIINTIRKGENEELALKYINEA